MICSEAGFNGDDFSMPWYVALYKDDNLFYVAIYPNGHTCQECIETETEEQGRAIYMAAVAKLKQR